MEAHGAVPCLESLLRAYIPLDPPPLAQHYRGEPSCKQSPYVSLGGGSVVPEFSSALGMSRRNTPTIQTVRRLLSHSAWVVEWEEDTQPEAELVPQHLGGGTRLPGKSISIRMGRLPSTRGGEQSEH